MSSMTSFAGKILLALVLLLPSGCCILRVSELTPFPPEPKYKEHTRDPVISYDKNSKTFVVTDILIDTAAKDKLYLEAIHTWRRSNGVP